MRTSLRHCEVWESSILPITNFVCYTGWRVEDKDPVRYGDQCHDLNILFFDMYKQWIYVDRNAEVNLGLFPNLLTSLSVRVLLFISQK